MPLDTRIPLGGDQQPSPIDQMAKAMTLQHLMKQSELAPLQMEAAQQNLQQGQMEIDQTQQDQQKEQGIQQVFAKYAAPGSGKDKMQLIEDLTAVDPQFAMKYADHRSKTDADFDKAMRDKHAAFTEASWPLAKSALDDWEAQVKSGVPEEIALKNIQPRIAASFNMLEQDGFGKAFHGGDPNAVTIEDLRNIVASSPDARKIEATAQENKLNRDSRIDAANIRASHGGRGSMRVQDYEYYNRLPTDADREEFLRVTRADQQLNLGDRIVIPGRVDPSQPTASFDKELPPQDTPEHKAEAAAATAAGTAGGQAVAEQADREAALPNLENVAAKLGDLLKTATYTKAGVGVNEVKRQLGMDVGQGAVDRAKYISIIDNEILPLLRPTFGSAFTQKEGDSLKVTLGDPNKSPEEKSAVLDAFMERVRAQIETGKRRVGATAAPVTAPTEQLTAPASAPLTADESARLQELRARHRPNG